MSQEVVIRIFGLMFDASMLLMIILVIKMFRFPFVMMMIKEDFVKGNNKNREKAMKVLRSIHRTIIIIIPFQMALSLGGLFGVKLLQVKEITLFGIILANAEQKTPLLVLICTVVMAVLIYYFTREIVLRIYAHFMSKFKQQFGK